MLVQEFSFQELLERLHQPGTAFVPMVKSSDDITRSVLKLVNQEGGTVVLGFDRSNLNFPGTTIGADWVDVVIKNDCSPEIDFRLKEMFHAGKKALIIEIKEGLEKPYYITGTIQSPPKIEEPEQVEETMITEQHSPNGEQEPALKEQKSSEMSFNYNNAPDTINELNRREKKALNYLKKNGSVSNKEYREINQVSSKTAHNELSRMIALGFLQQQGEGRLTRYILINSEPQPQQPAATETVSEQQQPIDDYPADNRQQIQPNDIGLAEIPETPADRDQDIDLTPETDQQTTADFPNDINEFEQNSFSQPQESLDPEDENFMSIFNDGVDFIDKLGRDIESHQQQPAAGPVKKTKKLNTRVPLFDFNPNSDRLTKTDLRAEGILQSHLPR